MSDGISKYPDLGGQLMVPLKHKKGYAALRGT